MGLIGDGFHNMEESSVHHRIDRWWSGRLKRCEILVVRINEAEMI